MNPEAEIQPDRLAPEPMLAEVRHRVEIASGMRLEVLEIPLGSILLLRLEGEDWPAEALERMDRELGELARKCGASGHAIELPGARLSAGTLELTDPVETPEEIAAAMRRAGA